MTVMTAPATVEDVRRWCDRAGMRTDSPLRLALMATTEAALAARDAAAGARSLTPDGERELIQRVSEAAALGTEREMLRLSRRLDVRLAFGLTIAALLLLAIGYTLGRWQLDTDRSTIRNAAFLGRLAELNDMTLLRQHCENSAFQRDGRLACTLPAIWIGAPSR